MNTSTVTPISAPPNSHPIRGLECIDGAIVSVDRTLPKIAAG